MYTRTKDYHKDNSDILSKRREYADIYVSDVTEAQAIDTDDYIQGSKLYVVETAQLYVLDREGGNWRNAADGSLLA